MFCSKCGKEIDENSKFCSRCGNPIIDAQEPTQEKLKTKLFKPRNCIFSIYFRSVFLTIGAILIRFALQREYSVMDWYEGRKYYLGLDPTGKIFCLLIPVIMILDSLMLCFQDKNDWSKKAVPLIASIFFAIVSVLFIVIDFPG